VGRCRRLIENQRSQVVVEHALDEVHVVTLSTIEEQTVPVVESLHAQPIFQVLVLLLEADLVTLRVPHAEPFRLARHHDSVLIPHPQAEVLD